MHLKSQIIRTKDSDADISVRCYAIEIKEGDANFQEPSGLNLNQTFTCSQLVPRQM